MGKTKKYAVSIDENIVMATYVKEAATKFFNSTKLKPGETMYFDEVIGQHDTPIKTIASRSNKGVDFEKSV